MNIIKQRIIKKVADDGRNNFDPNEWIEYYKRKPLSVERLCKTH